MGGSGGGSGQPATSSSSPWGPSQTSGKLYLDEMMQTLFPGTANQAIPGLGIKASKNGSALPSLPSMPAGLNQQVAPMTQPQTDALSSANAITPAAMNLTGAGANTVASFASGAQQNNPYLDATFNQAATGLTNQYNTGTAPAAMAQAEQSGSFGGTGMNNAMTQNAYGYGQGLATLGANIYEPAYAQGQQNQLAAAQALPASAMALYNPLQAQYGAGAAQQNQNQTVLNTNYTNAAAQAQWPFTMLSELGSAFGATAGAGGTSVGIQPSISAGGKW